MTKSAEFPRREVLVSNAEILQIIDELAAGIAEKFKQIRASEDDTLHLLVVLDGGMRFGIHLQEALQKQGVATTLDSIRASNYGRDLVATDDPLVGVINKTQLTKDGYVLVVDDISHTGRTLARILRSAAALGPSVLLVAALLFKSLELEIPTIFSDKEAFFGRAIPFVQIDGFGTDNMHNKEMNRSLPDFWVTIQNEEEAALVEEYRAHVRTLLLQYP